MSLYPAYKILLEMDELSEDNEPAFKAYCEEVSDLLPEPIEPEALRPFFNTNYTPEAAAYELSTLKPEISDKIRLLLQTSGLTLISSIPGETHLQSLSPDEALRLLAELRELEPELLRMSREQAQRPEAGQ